MTETWNDAAYRLFKAQGVQQVAYVPDGGLKSLINDLIADNDIESVPVTTEEEAIALSAGAWLGGQRAVVMMQSSGVGNTINAIASITMTCRFPLVMIVTMRGDYGEANPWQIPMGQATPKVLEDIGMKVFPVETVADAQDALAAGMTMAYESSAPVAILVSQRLIGAKPFRSDPPFGQGAA